MELLQWWDTALIALAAIAAIAGNIARIQGTYGSVRNWIRRRAEIAQALAEESESIRQTLRNLTENLEQLSADVGELKEFKIEGQALDMIFLRDQILEMTDRAIRRGYEHPDEIDKINTLVDMYQRRGGNGAVTSRVTRVRQLPIQHRREPWELDC